MERARVAPPAAPPTRVEQLRALLAELTPEERAQLGIVPPAEPVPPIPVAPPRPVAPVIPITPAEVLPAEVLPVELPSLLEQARGQRYDYEPVRNVRIENGRIRAEDSFGRPLWAWLIIDRNTGKRTIRWRDSPELPVRGFYPEPGYDTRLTRHRVVGRVT